MTRLFYPSHTEAVTCRRCGNSMPADTETCPHCGADQGSMLKPANAAALHTGLRMPFTTRRDNARVASPYPSLPEQSDLIGIEERHWDRSKTITLGAVVLALGVGGVIYWQHGDSVSPPEPATGQSASGPIDAKFAHDESTSTSKPAATVTGVPPSKLATTGTASTNRPSSHGTAAATVQAAIAPAVPAATAVAPRAPTSAAAPRDNGSAAASANAGDNLQAARDAIERGDLTTARRRFSRIPASQLDTANAQRTQADLVRLEHTRDDMLQAARACEATGSWTCVRQDAREVLAVDASNAEAQSMVEQAITRSGWLNQNAPAATAHATRPAPAATTAPIVSAPSTLNQDTHLMARSRTVPHPPVSVPQQASDSTRFATVSHVPLTSPTYAPAPSTPHVTTVQHGAPPPYLPPTITRSEPAQPAPVRAAASQSSTSPATEAVAITPRAPSLSEAAPARVESAQGTNGATGTSGGTSGATTQIPQPPVARAATPAADPAALAAPPAVSTATGALATHAPARTVASTDGAASGAQAKAAAFSSANPDDEERAIREFGWKKGDVPKPRSIAPSE
jgi:hypothetical protein